VFALHRRAIKGNPLFRASAAKVSGFGIYLGFHIERSVLRSSGGADCLANCISYGQFSGI